MSYQMFDTSLALEIEVAQKICAAIDTPRSLTVSLLVKYEQWNELLALECEPLHYSNPEAFANDYLCTKMLSKSKELPTGINLEDRAVESFFEGESMCKQTNSRLFKHTSQILEDTRQVVAKIIGPLAKSQLQMIERGFRHGPGATFSHRGSGSVRSDKYRARPTLTDDLIPFTRAITGDRWADNTQSFEVVPGNRFTTVPKNSKTDRGICIEPTLNVYAQLGVGAYIKQRLQLFGCNLFDQSRNQFLASKAKEWDLATIDLSLASDTLSCSLVERLLPPRWFELLDLLRSKRTNIRNEWVILEKFSSMGNGFTFELESLVFYSLCLAIVPPDQLCFVGVYGDDIIVPQRYAAKVIEGLIHFGFKPNRSKTHLAGEFFESCGTDWFNSQPVRPFYLKQDTKHIPYALQIANHLRLWSERRGIFGYCDPKLRDVWRWLVFAVLPKSFRIWVPKHAGDVGVMVSRREAEKHLVRSTGTFDHTFVSKKLVLAPKRRRFDDMALLLEGLSNMSEFTKGREPVRGFLGRHKIVRAKFLWPDGFEWV